MLGVIRTQNELFYNREKGSLQKTDHLQAQW